MKAILVIEDEPDVRAMLELVLADAGYDVVTTEGGYEALDALHRRRFDIALSDLKMPGMDGLQTMAAMKAIDPGLKVAIMTGFATTETAAECVARGAIGFLKKPFDLADLFTLLGPAVAPPST